MAHNTINHSLFPMGIRRYLLLIVCLALFIGAVSAATTQVHVVKYANDETTILAEQTVNYSWMSANLPVLGDGTTHYYHQGPVFVDDLEERWNPAEDRNVQEKDMGAAKGTNVKDLCNLVGGMSDGDRLKVKSSDGFFKWFAYENVYQYSSREGPMVVTWYTDFDFDPATPGKYPDTGYTDGMRLVWFADDGVNPWGIHAFGNYDWHEAAAPEYWYYYIQGGENYPTTTGLSAKYVSDLMIYSTQAPGGAPVAAFISDVQSGTVPLTVHFTDQSTGSAPLTYAWDFQNDGTVDSTVQNPQHTFTAAGNYTISLTVTNSAGSDREIKTDYITVSPASIVPPVAAFGSDVQSGTAPLTVHFTDASTGTPTSWAWDFNNDGTVDSTTQSPSHIYDTAGTYTVNLTVTNSAGSDSEVKTDYVTVQSSGGSTTVIIPSSIDTFIVDSGGVDDDLDWIEVISYVEYNERSLIYFDTSGIPSGATITSATLHMHITDTIEGDAPNDIHRITGGSWDRDVEWSTTPAFEAIPTDSQFTGSSPYAWVVWDVTPDVQMFVSGTPNYGWVIKYPTESDPDGIAVFYNTLESSDPTVRPYLEVTYSAGGPAVPTAVFSADTTAGVAPLTVQFTDESTGSPTLWAWDFGDSSTSTQKNPSHTYNSEGTYTVSLTATNAGGSSTETKTGYIAVTPAPVAPTANFTADVTTGTAPLEVQFVDSSEGTSPLTYAWDFTNDGTVDSTEQFPAWIYNDPGTYTVSLTVTNAVGSDTEAKTDFIEVASPYPTLLWGPYLTGTTTAGTVVNVKTDMATAVTVEYATDTYYTANTAYDQSATDGATDTLHHVTLAGLAMDTLYHYRVVYDGQETSDFHFRTFPASGPVTFIVYSDTQDQLPTFSQLERHKLVADRIAEEPDVLFVLNSGDLVNNAADLNDWDRYFAAGSMMMANTTVYPALGNHDDNDPNYFAAYGVPAYYSFDCGDGHVAVLDSNDWAWPDLPTQSAWLATDLQTAKPFKFTSFHHPIYSSDSKHFGGWENLRQEWEDDFNNNGVLAVFNGHVHAYERLLVNDTNYFVAGIGGAPSYNLATPRYEASVNSLEYMIGYTRVTVDPSAGTATAEVIRVADVSTDLKTLTNIYPANTVFETVVMTIAEPPVANFTAEPEAGLMPLTVQFTDTTSGSAPFTYLWNFGDGATSTEQNPSHTYAAHGNYTVTLTATNSAGADTETKESYIIVTLPPPAADFTASPVTGIKPLTVQFTDISAGNEIDSWAWDIDNDGTTDYTTQNPSHTYNDPGTNTVSLTVTNPGGSSGKVKEGFITVTVPLPVADFTATPSSGNAPLDVQFTDLSTNMPTSWSWSFGDGATSDQQNPVHEYTAAGTYMVNLTVSNTAGSDSEEKPGYITVTATLPDPPVVNFVGDVRSGSPPLTVNFTDQSTNSPTAWSWDFQNDGIIDSTEQNPAYTYTTPGTYQVNLTASNAGGSAFRLKGNYIKVTQEGDTNPAVDFTADSRAGTAPFTVQFTDLTVTDPIAWSWDFQNDGVIDSNLQNPSYTYMTAGTYQVNLTATNATGTASRLKANYITVSESSGPSVATVTVSPDSVSLTTGDGQQFTATAYDAGGAVIPGAVFNWSNSDETVGTVNGTGFFTARARGTTTITAESGGVPGTAGVEVSDTSLIHASFTSDTAGGRVPCVVRFTDTSTGEGITGYEWDFGDGSTSTRENPTHIYVSAGEYTVTLKVSSATGTDTATGTIVVTGGFISPGSKVSARFTASPSAGRAPLEVQFTDRSSGAESWSWDFGDGSTSTEQNPVHVYTSTGTYTVTLSITGAGGSAETTGTVMVIKGSTIPGGNAKAQFTASPIAGRVPLEVQFTAQTSWATNWSWDFGDGTNSTDTNPVHVFNEKGTYHVTLVAIVGNTNETATKTIWVI